MPAPPPDCIWGEERGVGQMLTIADGGGGGGPETPDFGWRNMWTAPYWWFFCDICSQSLDHKLWQKTNIFKILASNQEMGYTHTWHCRTNIVCRWNAQIIRNQLVNCFALHRHCTTDWHRQEAILVSCANINTHTHTHLLLHNNFTQYL